MLQPQLSTSLNNRNIAREYNATHTVVTGQAVQAATNAVMIHTAESTELLRWAYVLQFQV
jgi:hypothetical protein